MTQTERVYSCTVETGLTKWFFPAREGIFGPFSSKETALDALDVFVKTCIKKQEDGGRISGINPLQIEQCTD